MLPLSLGCQKMRQGPLNTPFVVWCANIAHKLKNIQNTLRKQGCLAFFFFNFDDFSKFVPFGGNLTQWYILLIGWVQKVYEQVPAFRDVCQKSS